MESDFVTFFSRDKSLKNITLDNVNLDDDRFDYFDPKAINHVRLMAWHNKYKQQKALKKIDGKLRPASWRPRRW